MQRAFALCATLALSACASRYALVPPRLALEPYGRVALITFSTDQADTSLGTLATQKFAEALLASQTGFELLEVSPGDAALRGLTPSSDPVSLAQKLGREKDVPAVFLGHLSVSGMKPQGRLGAGGTLNVKASVTAELTVQLLSTRTGGTVWRSSSAASSTVGRVAIGDRLPSISVRDPNDAYGAMVHELAVDVTRDLRPTRVKQ